MAPLLVFDHLDADLGQDGRATMRMLLAHYPGVVIVASDDPDQLLTQPTHGTQRHQPDRTAADRRRGIGRSLMTTSL